MRNESNNADLPKSLLQATRYFADPDVCVEFVAAMRWPNGVVCPHCGRTRFLSDHAADMEVPEVSEAIQC